MNKAYSEITKYDVYNERMALSMMDKLFFVDKTDATMFVDFGAADGTLFKYMRLFVPEKLFLGYDNDPTMCHAAQKAADAAGDIHTTFLSKWDGEDNGHGNTVRVAIQRHRERCTAAGNTAKVALILSSVVHEVYHYSDPRQIDKFWADIFGLGFDYIILRDMIPSESVDRAADIGDVQKVLRQHRDKKELKDFERRWGSIQSNKNLVHYLLKYRYSTPNWEREVKENYLPLYWEDLMGMLPRDYDVLYHEHGVLPYIKRGVRDDFGIELKDATHLKLILEKR